MGAFVKKLCCEVMGMRKRMPARKVSNKKFNVFIFALDAKSSVDRARFRDMLSVQNRLTWPVAYDLPGNKETVIMIQTYIALTMSQTVLHFVYTC